MSRWHSNAENVSIYKRINDEVCARVCNVRDIVVLLELGFCDEIVVVEQTNLRKDVCETGLRELGDLLVACFEATGQMEAGIDGRN